MGYALDRKAAEKAETFGQYLNETGKYIGHFDWAESVKSQNTGTLGVRLHFIEDNDQTSTFTLWTVKADGTQLSGYNALQAIMTCLKVKDVTDAQGQVLKYNSVTQQQEKVVSVVHPELANKRIGLLLQSTEYQKQNNAGTGWRLEFFGAFEADTEFTASEIFKQATKPEQLEKMVAKLADRPLKNKPTNNNNYQPQSAGMPPAFDDDCPF